jgi:5,6-dimethylbenzimidazole synthase
VRRFRLDPLPPGTLERLIHIACLSPSVGLSQPWRFVIVDYPARRRAIAEVFEACNAEALSSHPRALGDRYAKLKLAGIKEAPAQLTVFADRGTGVGHGLGRRTIPEMIEYSVVTAVHTMWLAARAEGIGFGWVSILDPARMAEILDVPPDWHLIGHLCLGYPETETKIPELERAEWENRKLPSKAIIRR